MKAALALARPRGTLVSPVLPLAEAPRGYELMAQRRGGAIKALLRL